MIIHAETHGNWGGGNEPLKFSIAFIRITLESNGFHQCLTIFT